MNELNNIQKRDMLAIFFMSDFMKEWKARTVEDLPPDVAVVLMAFTAMSDEGRKELLTHLTDTFCMRCGRLTDGRDCHCDAPCSRCGDVDQGGMCICYAR